MPGKTVKIRATEGGEFDCYLAQPAGGDKVPAVVLACAVHGVDADIRQIADEFAGHGFIAAAPDLFWRTVPGPLGHDDKRTQERSQPRLEKIKTGERDLVDTLTHLRTLAGFNGRAADDGLLLRRALRHPRPEAARLCRRHLVPRLADARLHQGARRRRPSRSASSGATRTIGRRRRCSTPIVRCRRA